MIRGNLFLHNRVIAPLGSPRDILIQAMWIREQQQFAFETLINIFANSLSINPDISSKITDLTNEYLEICIPGSEEARKANDKTFVAKAAKTLEDVTQLLINYNGNTLKLR